MAENLQSALLQVRLKLRDKPITGIQPQYTDGELCVFIANALARLFRSRREAFFGIMDVPVKIAAIRAIHLERNDEPAFMESTDQNLLISLPVAEGTDWIGYVTTSTTAEAEGTQQQGTNQEAAVNLQVEEAQQG